METQSKTQSLSQRFFGQLSEKDKRLFAAQEAHRRGWGGIKSVMEEFHIARSTISLGIAALESDTPLPSGRVRNHGGGRKRRLEKEPFLHTVFLEILSVDIAGSPQDDVRWTYLSKPQIQQRLLERGYGVGIRVIDELLRHHGFGKRKHRKNVTMGENAHRDTQFQRMTELRAEFQEQGLPVCSIDTKKRTSR